MVSLTNNAIILAAGKGTRLLPITRQIPKCLIDINGRCILDRALHNLSESGITNVTIVVGYLQDKIKDMFGKRYLGMDIKYSINYEYETTNSMFSLLVGLLHNDAYSYAYFSAALVFMKRHYNREAVRNFNIARRIDPRYLIHPYLYWAFLEMAIGERYAHRLKTQLKKLSGKSTYSESLNIIK